MKHIKEALANSLEVAYKLKSYFSEIESNNVWLIEKKLGEIIKTLSKCEIDECRVIAAGYTDGINLTEYIDDPNKDVTTIAKVRIDFMNEYFNYSYKEKQQNEFLASAIENGVIYFLQVVGKEMM